jgi:hypothetical protein
MWAFGYRPVMVGGDDMPMHQLMTRLLRSLDASVDLCVDGHCLARAIDEKGKPYHALLLDLILCGTSGKLMGRAKRVSIGSV